MTAKKNAKKTSGGAVKDTAKNAAETVSRIKNDMDDALDTAKEAVLPTRALLRPRELDCSIPVPPVVKTAVLAFMFFLLFQFAWTGAGKIRSIYRQYREFRQWRQEWEEKALPIPLPDGEGLRKYIKKNFPRTIPAAERETAAQIFADAADAVESGELINRDDVLGYLGKNLRPVCRAPAWIAFLSNVWTEVDADADASPESLAGALREVAAALSEARAFIFVEAVEDLAPDPAEPPLREDAAKAEQTHTKAEQNCPDGSCPNQNRYNYGGLYWW